MLRCQRSKKIYEMEKAMNLPVGWKRGRGRFPTFITPVGKLLRGCSNAILELSETKQSDHYIQLLRNELENEGWKKSDLLPLNWFLRQYRQMIQGAPKNTLILLAPDGRRYRSQKKILHDHPEISPAEKANIHELFRVNSIRELSEEEMKEMENSGEIWRSGGNLVPPNWKCREYKFFSKNLQKEVNTKMYLSPDGTILQGERRMKQYLSKNNLNSTLTDTEQFTLLTSKPVKSKTLQSEMEERVWKNCDYHSLDNWKFRLSTEGQRFEYKSPDGEVFYSRGSVLRVLIKKGRTSYSELMMLKKLLKNNDNKINLKENDRFIRTLPVNQNFFIFIKTRYLNSSAPEISDLNLPKGWKKKIINEVEYLRNPLGNVFNSRRLALDHMKSTGEYTQTEIVRVAMDDLESESEISESDEDGEESSNMEIFEDKERMGIVEDDNQRENENDKDKDEGFRCREDEKSWKESEYRKNHKENKIEDLEDKMKNVVDKKMEKLEDEMENMEDKVENMEDKMENMEDKMENMKDKMENMEDKMENMEDKMENMEDKMENMEDERIETDEGLDLLYEDYPSDSSSISDARQSRCSIDSGLDHPRLSFQHPLWTHPQTIEEICSRSPTLCDANLSSPTHRNAPSEEAGRIDDGSDIHTSPVNPLKSLSAENLSTVVNDSKGFFEFLQTKKE
ncbi:spindle pole body component 110 isoform X2 [Eurytemora carolleeae]|uniref:spindle pole body component 110 isoform X2 n=1 Tax=Eurytemora carolleeae TaxID=1294199 RepID=UPI000C771A91|nr:spindle pole body component 110 isoform X2 [Eurytemora carolleeae]|eukprot:XP_023319689.1 spindle pole body component 110-like isoform X2 [Eurytemora affinis]